MSSCGKRTDEAPKAVAEHCPGLTRLTVGLGDKVIDEALKAVAEHCPGLMRL